MGISSKELRDFCKVLRRKPVELREIIEMLQRAADTIEESSKQVSDLSWRLQGEEHW